MFQSTYLYKVRLKNGLRLMLMCVFQSTYLYKVRRGTPGTTPYLLGFNPRTYIRYDVVLSVLFAICTGFQSTYLYKVRRRVKSVKSGLILFQSTYLYKVRPGGCGLQCTLDTFQSTYLYKVRHRYGVNQQTDYRVSIHVPI